MQLGAIFPQLEIGSDPVVIRDWAQTAEGVGFQHILAYDHVLGAGLSTRPGWRGPYNSESSFHEIMVLFGYLAAVTEAMELVTGVVILPQRQTVLVAKQAAEIDLLAGGRFRLGVGVGWNDVEYEGLNENFHNRGARSEEQIAVMRALWSAPTIDFSGRWHTITNAGINPLPTRRAIPVWIGGMAEATLKRIARIGDGWFPQRLPDDEARGMLQRLRDYASAAGRDPGTIGIEARLSVNQVPRERWEAHLNAWRELGATHLSVNFMGAGFDTPQAHVAALRAVKEALDRG